MKGFAKQQTERKDNMKHNRGKMIICCVFALILTFTMAGSSVFAAADSTTKARQTSGKFDKNAGYLDLSKEFTRDGETWPNQTSFNYNIEKVKAWDNSNASTNENGSELSVADMPAPALKSGNPPAWTVVPATNGVYKVNVPVKTETGTDTDPLKKAEGTATGTIGDIKFDFTRPGYYLYKISEVNDGVNGVIYDDHVYYVAFYVANKTAGNESDGETTGGAWTDDDQNVDKNGIYVHSVTVFRSSVTTGTNPQQIAEEYLPVQVDPAWNNQSVYYEKVVVTADNLEQIKADGIDYYTYDANATKNKYVKVTDKSKMTAGDYYKVVSEMRYKELIKTNVEKVGKSGSGGSGNEPNWEDVKFWNETKSGDIELEKKVTGTLGDLNKKFEFTIAMEKLTPNTEYTINLKTNAQVDAAEPLNGAGLTALTVASGTNNATFKAGTDGKATIKVKMKAKQIVQIKDLPQNAEYKVTEEKSDHKASVAVSGTGANGSNAKIATAAGTGNDAAWKELSTAKEKVDPEDGKVTITYTNHRDFETETGIPNFVFPVALAGILALIALALVRRKKKAATVDYFEF